MKETSYLLLKTNFKEKKNQKKNYIVATKNLSDFYDIKTVKIKNISFKIY